MTNEQTAVMKQKVHFISHTHWDREWYFSFQHYRYRLVYLINQLLEWLPDHEEFKYFHLDGQSIVVEDYLEVEPGNRERLLSHIREGRILIGPWYVLADEFLVSGESLIRNLLLGDRQCKEYGAKMNLGYLPDLFGHIGQMPQILRGFGIEDAILWRGISDRGEQLLPTEWVWRGTDGSEVLVMHLPDAYGYSNGSDLPYEPERLSEHLKRLHKETKTHSSTGQLLVMNGTDHQTAHLPIPGIVKTLNEKFEDFEVVHSTLPEYVQSVKADIGDRSVLPVYRGELRSTNHSRLGRFNFILPNVLSSRIYLKQWNEKVQTALERWAEPIASIAKQAGAPYPDSQLRAAWKYLLQNHPHDSICGCSIDDVHRQMMTRFEWANDIAEQVIAESMYAIGKRIAVTKPETDSIAFQVFNVLPFDVSETVEAEIHVPANVPFKDLELADDEGNCIPSKLLGITTKHVTPDFMEKWPPSNAYRTHIAKVCFQAEDVPALGYRTYYAKPVSKPNRKWTRFSEYRAAPRMENDYVKVHFNGNGSFDLLNKETGQWFKGLHVFEDGADIGDGYTYSEPIADSVFTTFGADASFRLAEHSAVRTVYEAGIDWMLPESAENGYQKRSERFVPCRLVSRIALAANGKRVDIETRFENKAKDHRLRVLFPTNLSVSHASAAGGFAVDTRSIHVVQPDKEVWLEDEPVTFPHKGFVDVSTGQTGLAVIAPGLMEYEISRTEERAVAITLLRSVGYLGAGPKPLTIVSGAGPDMETPESQCQGTHVFKYSIYAHRGDWETGDVFEQSQRFSVGLRAFQYRYEQVEPFLPASRGFLRWENKAVQFSAWKQAEETGSHIVRFYNPTPQEQSICITTAFNLSEAYIVNLKEDRIREISVEQTASGDAAFIRLSFRPGEIASVEFIAGY